MVPIHQWRAFQRGAVAILGAACFSLAAPVHARNPPRDLDALSDAQFFALLDNEMDDDDLEDCGFGDLNGRHTTQQAYDVIMCALSDEGDTDEENDLDFDDLQAEMREAGTTVEAVVRAAIQDADRRASGPLTRAVLVAALRRDAEMPTSDSSTNYPEWYAQIENGIINPPPNNITSPVKARLNAARKAVKR